MIPRRGDALPTARSQSAMHPADSPQASRNKRRSPDSRSAVLANDTGCRRQRREFTDQAASKVYKTSKVQANKVSGSGRRTRENQPFDVRPNRWKSAAFTTDLLLGENQTRLRSVPDSDDPDVGYTVVPLWGEVFEAEAVAPILASRQR